jgi:L-rhamnose-H+ transport protein
MHITGLLLIILGGVMEGLFSLPLKFTPKWSWENIWGAGSLCALVLVPWPLALLTVPHLGSVYAAADHSAILSALLFGAGWGCGGVFFGLGVASLGLSLGISMIMGLIAIGGSVVPLLLQHRDRLETKSGAFLLLGIGIMIAGLLISGLAGSLKAGPSKTAATSSPTRFAVGVFYCVAAGVLSALVNFALIFGAPIVKPVMAQGLDLATANNAVWALVFTSSYLVNLGYSLFKCFRQNTFNKFFRPRSGRYWLWAALMGILWAGGIVVYGRGASMGGTYGPVFGFPIMLIASILTGNIAGVLSGEWRSTPANARRTMAIGVGVMVLAIVVLGSASYATP